MEKIETTRMSSKGQVVIPEEVRSRLGLSTGDKFIVVGNKDVVILKSIKAPSMDEFEALIQKARSQAKAVNLKQSDIVDAIAETRIKS